MATPQDNHIQYLSKLCRICGLLLRKDTFEISANTERLSNAFLYDFRKDNNQTHVFKMLFDNAEHWKKKRFNFTPD